jgi:hypothetical protein
MTTWQFSHVDVVNHSFLSTMIPKINEFNAVKSRTSAGYIFQYKKSQE